MLELIGLYKTFNPGTVNEKRAINGLNLTWRMGISSPSSGATARGNPPP